MAFFGFGYTFCKMILAVVRKDMQNELYHSGKV